MKLFKHWALLVLAGHLAFFSYSLWPNLAELGLSETGDLITAILFRPFHYILSILFLFFVMLIFTQIMRKVIYEVKVAYLFKRIPYETILLAILSLTIFLSMLRFHLILTLLFTIGCSAYYLLDYLLYHRKEREYLRE